MKSVSQELLVRQQRLSSEYAFAATTARFAEHDAAMGLSEMSFATHNAAYQLQQRIIRLHLSPLPVDIQAVKNIDAFFNEKDVEAMSDDFEIGYTEQFRILEWLAESAYTDIAKFALWNKRRHETLQHRLNEDQPLLQANVLTRVGYLVGQDIIPTTSETTYQETFNRYGEFKAMDTFEKGLKSASGFANSNIIAIANHFIRDDFYGHTRTLKDTAFHEYTHGVGFHDDRGFLYGTWTHPVIMRWLEEHAVSHLTAVSTAEDQPVHSAGQPSVYFPYDRNDSDYPYPVEATYFGVLDMQLPEGIPADLLGHAYMTPRNTARGEMLRRDLEKRLIKASGSAKLLFDLTDSYEAAETQAERNTILEKEIQRLAGVSTSIDEAASIAANIHPVVAASFKE